MEENLLPFPYMKKKEEEKKKTGIDELNNDIANLFFSFVSEQEKRINYYHEIVPNSFNKQNLRVIGYMLL